MTMTVTVADVMVISILVIYVLEMLLREVLSIDFLELLLSLKPSLMVNHLRQLLFQNLFHVTWPVVAHKNERAELWDLI